jgi:hypothetical protein
VKELERLRAEAQAHTSRAISELKSNFSALSEQVASQLSGFTSSFNETTQQVRNSTHQAAAELEHTQSELKRQAKSLPEATKQSAKAMRRALQDQLSALDSLTEITSRHGYSGQISKPDARPPEPSHPPRMMPPPPHENRDLPPLSASRRDVPPPPPRGAYGEEWGAPQDTLEAVSAGLIERMDNSPRVEAQHDYDSMGRPPIMGSPAPNPEVEHERGGAKWSLGDLLARASLVDDNNYAGARNDDSYGAPPIAAPPAGAARKPENMPMIFDMKDIANAVEENIASDVWRRYHKGERNILNRGIYNRDGQATFDQVKRRYESDTTFRHIVDRYLADFERMLQDASKADPKGRTVQTHLTSETGRIYLVLGHASGRLVV